jgi:cystathionine beta-synthase
VLLPDTGRNYINGFYADRWMEKNGFIETKGAPTKVSEILEAKPFSKLISIGPNDNSLQALSLLESFQISQVPVIRGAEILGTVHEISLMKLLHDGVDLKNMTVADIMGKPLPTIDADAEVGEAYRLLLSGSIAIIVTNDNVPTGIVSRIDLVDHWLGKDKDTKIDWDNAPARASNLGKTVN